jgi:cytoskeletal protein CcmA (bactofilin family)
MANYKRRQNTAPAVIDSTTWFTGNMYYAGDLIVKGTIDGNLVVYGSCTVEEDATVTGNILCETAEISGEVKGELIIGLKYVSVLSSAKVAGQIYGPRLTIDQGAELDLTLRISGEHHIQSLDFDEISAVLNLPRRDRERFERLIQLHSRIKQNKPVTQVKAQPEQAAKKQAPQEKVPARKKVVQPAEPENIPGLSAAVPRPHDAASEFEW